jgi:hypothetical protein
MPGCTLVAVFATLSSSVSLLRLPAMLTAGHPGDTQGVQYDRISDRQPAGVQNNLVCILDEGVECNAPTFVPENLAAVIAGGFHRIPIAVMPYGAAL